MTNQTEQRGERRRERRKGEEVVSSVQGKQRELGKNRDANGVEFQVQCHMSG